MTFSLPSQYVSFFLLLYLDALKGERMESIQKESDGYNRLFGWQKRKEKKKGGNRGKDFLPGPTFSCQPKLGEK